MTEFFDVVNKNDNIIGMAARKECHSNPKLIHRAVNIFVLNSNGQILLQRRSIKADTDPLKWSVLFGEHNMLGEDYDSAAKRGLKEELGLEGIVEDISNGANILSLPLSSQAHKSSKINDLDYKLKRFSKVFWKGKIQTEFNVNYVFIFDGKISSLNFDRNEIKEIKFEDIEKVKEMLKNNGNEFVGYGKCMFEELLKHIDGLK